MSVKILQDDEFYVGDDVFVEVRLFDEATKTQATGRTLQLILTKPDKTTKVTSYMSEVGSGEPGIYQGQGVFDAEGNWRIEVKHGSRFVFRHEHVYVAA